LVGEIVGAAATDVGNIDAKIEQVLAAGVGDDVGAVEVVFGGYRITSLRK
jgi:hypothetical protein